MIRSAVILIAAALGSVSAYAETSKPTKAPVKKAAVVKALPAADQSQLEAAERAHFGPYACDFNQSIDVRMNPKSPGYVDVKFKSKTYTMKPSVSSTGAVRLEDVTGQTLLLQIANKSMLMDVRAGKRLVDDCVHENQRAASAASKQ